MKTTLSKLATLEQQLAANERKQKRLKKSADKCFQEWRKLKDRIHRERLLSLVGQQVKRKYRGSAHPELNDAVGTLLNVKRSRCRVDFGDALGEWNMPIDGVTWLDDSQGEEICWGGAK